MNSGAKQQQSDNEFAVLVKNCCKSYKQAGNTLKILDQLNLNVHKGAVYGLLGPSGCGKTTLLRCILGRLLPDRGKVRVFGHCPGSEGSGIPGPKIGYMPQDTSLFDTMTIGETLTYYGAVLGLSDAHIKSRIKLFEEILKLPSPNTLNSKLSGGQARRVSFAVTVIHDPQLIILDEPTVGIDPIVRQSMWDYLFNMVETLGCTIILTTHYIEEARSVGCVGMMQDGRLLVEDSPETLISRFGCSTLEEVFFCVCMQSQEYENEFDDENDPLIALQRNKASLLLKPASEPLSDVRVDFSGPDVVGNDRQQVGNHYQNNILNGKRGLISDTDDDDAENSYRKNDVGSNSQEKIENVKINAVVGHKTNRLKKIASVFKKNAICLYRFPGALLYFFVYPAIQLLVMGFALGGSIHDLPIGVWNQDTGHLGEVFLSHCNPDLVIQEPFSNYQDGYQSILDGNTYAFIQIRENFSDSFIKRFKDSPLNSNETLYQSIITVELDDSHFQITKTLHFEFLDAFQSFSKAAMEDAGLNPLLAQLPIGTNDNVFGWLDQPFRTYLMPGLIFLISYFAPMPVALMSIFMDKITGNLERSYIAGVGSFEIMMGFMALQMIIVCSQVIMVGVVAFVVFTTPMYGSYVLLIALCIASSMSGMVLGVFMSAMYDDVINLCVWAFFAVFSSLAISGLFWPLDAMPYVFQCLCMVMPYYAPTQAMYGILYKGWDLYHKAVYQGFLCNFGWFSIYFVAALVTFRYKRYSPVI